MNRYNLYKDSGISWLGNIPSNWDVTRNKYFTIPIQDKSETGTEELLSVSEKKGVIPRRSIRNEEEHLSTSKTLVGYLKVLPGDLVSNIMLMWKRGLGVSNFKGIVSPSYSVFRFIDSEPKYYHYLFRTDQYVSEFRRNSTGVIESRLRLYDDSFGFMSSHRPPLSEQQQIVSFLDDKTQKIDSLIEKNQRNIELLKEKILKLIEGVLLNPKTKRVRLEHVVDLIKRPIEREENKMYTKIGMYNWGRGIFKYPSELGSELGDSSFNYLKERDLLLSGQFSWEGSVSIVENEEDNCISSHRFHILNGKRDKILNEYLWSYFISQEGHFILNENSPGSAGRNRPLNIGKLLKEKIPVPEMDVQMKIKRLVIETRNFEKCSKKNNELLKEYRQSLISEVVTGKIRVCKEDNSLSLNSQTV